MKTSLLIYSVNQLTGFFTGGTLGLKKVSNIKSANWFMIDFLSNVKVFYIILLTVYETSAFNLTSYGMNFSYIKDIAR